MILFCVRFKLSASLPLPMVELHNGACVFRPAGAAHQEKTAGKGAEAEKGVAAGKGMAAGEQHCSRADPGVVIVSLFATVICTGTKV